MRKAIVEMMFAEGNHFCPSCEKSGNCSLQHMGYELGVSASRFPHLFEDRLIDYHPRRMVLEHNRCIKCRRCVEEVKSPDGKRVFTYLNRGNDTRVGIDYTQEALLSDEQAHDAMNLCPTGAILVRGMTPLKPFGDRPFDLLSSQVDFKRMMKERSESRAMIFEEVKAVWTSWTSCLLISRRSRT
jgi:[NiFe] hydrogenase diaphorase moiety small subunit